MVHGTLLCIVLRIHRHARRFALPAIANDREQERSYWQLVIVQMDYLIIF